MLGAALLGRERLTWPKTAGVLLTMLGVALALGDKLLEPGRTDSFIGAAAVLLAACCGAVCSVLSRPFLQRYPTLPVGAFAMLASVGFLALLALWAGAFSGWPGFCASGGGAEIGRGAGRGG